MNDEIKYWGGKSGLVHKHVCKIHGGVPVLFMHVTFNEVLTSYPYCSFCWGEQLSKDFPIICSKETEVEDDTEGDFQASS